jgi:type I restriction enzyme R subunit
VKLADGKEREIQHMVSTTFWHPDGTPISDQQFMELLFGKLPEFFKDEAELRALWSAPDTRKKLLKGLEEKGLATNNWSRCKKSSTLRRAIFSTCLSTSLTLCRPVLAKNVADRAKVAISAHFNSKQQAFLDFVLSHYVQVGVEELDQEKLTPLLRLKYHNSITDALADLGQADEIGLVFAGFQKYLYQPQAIA